MTQKPRWMKNQEARDWERRQIHEVIQQCRDGNIEAFSLLKQYTDISLYMRFGVKPEEYRAWKQAYEAAHKND